MANNLRRDYFLDRWVIVAEGRSKRPDDFRRKGAVEKEGATCAFCFGSEDMTPPEIDRITHEGMWVVRCFPNKYPATTNKRGRKVGRVMMSTPAYGSHEIIVESPKHDDELGDLSVDRILDVFEMINRRITALEKVKGIKYVNVFKNRGPSAGASLAHSHFQVMSLPIVPTLVLEEAEGSFRRGFCGFCRVLRKEAKGDRSIIENKHAVAFTPYASRFPMEAWIMPKRHVGRLSDLKPVEAEALAEALKKVIEAANTGLNYPPYNLVFHHSPSREDLHFHLEFCPKMSILAGYEIGSGSYINVVSPEDAARYYRRRM